MQFINYLIEYSGLILAALLCIMSHEVAHAYVALLNGDPTAKIAGRISFNPARHFDLFGFAFFILARVGYAKPVPVSTANFKHPKVGVITVSISGIVVNLLSSFLFVPIFLLFVNFIYPLMAQNVVSEAFGRVIYYFLYYTVVIGVNLALFNLLPLYPLDGYHFLEGLVNPSNKIMRFLRDYGWLIIMGVVIYSIIVSRIGLPAYYDPLYWYLNVVGGYIRRFFALIWAPLFV